MKLKLANETLSVLKSLSTINQSLMFRKGKTQKTLSVAKTIFATVELEDEFPIDFGIYDLSEFLNTISLFDKPTIDFGEQKAIISDESGARCSYTYSDPNVIVSPPEKGLEMPSVELTFDLTKGDLEKLMKAASVLALPDVSVTNENGQVVVGVTDSSNNSSNGFSLNLGTTDPDKNFIVNIRAELLKLLPDDYSVEVSEKGFSRFVGKNNKSVYFVALETNSSFS